MPDEAINRIFEKLDSIDAKVNQTNISLAELTTSSNSYNKKCEKNHVAIFGDERSMGLRAKMWVVWGLLVAGGSILVGILIVWIRNILPEA